MNFSFNIDKKFVDGYRNKKPDFGFEPLGELTYLRTYSRMIGDKKETWIDTLERVVNGTYSLQKRWIIQHDLGWSDEDGQRSAQEMFDKMFHMKFLPPGRGLWAMGSSITEERHIYAALNNCGFISTEDIEKDLAEPFCFMMDMMMLGVGIGFDTKGAGKIMIYTPDETGQTTYQIPDTREGWTQSLRMLINSYLVPESTSVEFEYSLIRKKGTPIKCFGGTASGPEPLQDLHRDVRKTLDRHVGKTLTITGIADIFNMIGCCVVAGNVRRCLHKDSMVHINSTMIPIKLIKVGNMVQTRDGYRKVTAVFEQGKQELYSLNTSHRDQGLLLTLNHRLAVTKDGKTEWKMARDLEEGDELVSVITGLDLGNGSTVKGETFKSLEYHSVDESYDIEVEGNHEFFVNGILSHNSAEIAFGDPDNEEFINLKNYEINPERMAYGWASNNSIFGKIGMDYSHVGKSMAINGEPGIAWLDNMISYSRMNSKEKDYKDFRIKGANPCNEQGLENYELCCLVETFPERCTDLEDYNRTLKFAYLYAKTVTLGKTHWPNTNRVLLRNRRIGCSMSGIAQFIQHRGLDTLKKWCKSGFKTIQKYDEIYSNWFCIPRSIKTTSIKPSGTVSLLAGATPGMHYPQSNYYIRRIRISDDQVSLLKSLREAGYGMEEDKYSKNTIVVSLPLKVDDGSNHGIRPTNMVSMWEQLSLAAFLQKYWADNQVSVTVTFNPDEADQIPFALNYFQYQLKGVSFLPLLNGKKEREIAVQETCDYMVKLLEDVSVKSTGVDSGIGPATSTADTLALLYQRVNGYKNEKGGPERMTYAQMPYETISPETYAEMRKNIKPVNFNEKTDSVAERYCDGDKCTL